jgi:hypothetical protein
MTDKSANSLAKRIRRESTDKVRIVFGHTNGKTVLHVINQGLADKRFASNTIRSAVEWYYHPWNRYVRTRKEPKTA